MMKQRMIFFTFGLAGCLVACNLAEPSGQATTSQASPLSTPQAVKAPDSSPVFTNSSTPVSQLSGSSVPQKAAAQKPSPKPTQRLTVITSRPKAGFLGVGLQAVGDLDGDGKGDLLVARQFGETEFQQERGRRRNTFIPGQDFKVRSVNYFDITHKSELLVRSPITGQNGAVWGDTSRLETNAFSKSPELMFGGFFNSVGIFNIDAFTPEIVVNSQANNNIQILQQFTYSDNRRLDLPDANPPLVKGFGSQVAFLGDVNGDGLGDYLIGEPKGSVDFHSLSDQEKAKIPNIKQLPIFGYELGRCHVIFGQQNPTPIIDSKDLNGKNGFILVGHHNIQKLCGRSVPVGDFNGDGFNDFIVAEEFGKSFLIWGQKEYNAFEPVTDFVQDANKVLPIKNFYLNSLQNIARDMNQDGRSDILLSIREEFAEPFDPELDNTVILVYGPQSKLQSKMDLGSLKDKSLKFVKFFNFKHPNQRFVNISAQFVDDLNGDKIPDILISDTNYIPTQEKDPRKNDFGKVYVIYGQKEMPDSIDVTQFDGKNGFTIEGRLPEDHLGTAMAVTDFDGDGYQDLILSASQYAGASGYVSQSYGNGKLYILYGSEAGFDAQIDLNTLEPKRDEPLITHEFIEPGATQREVVVLE